MKVLAPVKDRVPGPPMVNAWAVSAAAPTTTLVRLSVVVADIGQNMTLRRAARVPKLIVGTLTVSVPPATASARRKGEGGAGAARSR